MITSFWSNIVLLSWFDKEVIMHCRKTHIPCNRNPEFIFKEISSSNQTDYLAVNTGLYKLRDVNIQCEYDVKGAIMRGFFPIFFSG